MMRHGLLLACLVSFALAAHSIPLVNESTLRAASNNSVPTNNGTLYYTPQFQFLLDMYFNGIPHSYEAKDHYWRTEQYLTPAFHSQPIDGQIAIQDRTCTKFGLNLYDGATWEIGLSLQGELEVPFAYEYNTLYASSTGTDNDVGGLLDIRSDTPLYLYGAKQVPGDQLAMVTLPANQTNPNDGTTQIPGAFYFRMISTHYVTEDPLIGSYSSSFKYPDPFTGGPSWNTFGVIVWNDWKPITGENVWSSMIGPLQALWIASNGTIPEWADFAGTPPQVKQALSVLPALDALLSVEGSLYHCPQGTQMWPPDENEATNVSNENNFSGYAAITMLLDLLVNNTNTTGSDLEDDIQTLQNLQSQLEGWFIQYGLSPPINETGNRVFYQGGHVNFTGGFYPVNIYDDGGFAVDCQTWGSAVLGADFIDNKIANQVGTAYNIWQQTKEYSGYYAKDGSIAGVGYTIHPKHEIWSAEWSWGAVLMTRELSNDYKAMGCSQCAQWAQDLMNDSISMENNLAKPVSEGGMITESGGYLYCNMRYFIPWGWWANPLPATCSTAWAIMNDHRFNPFVLGGGSDAWFY